MNARGGQYVEKIELQIETAIEAVETYFSELSQRAAAFCARHRQVAGMAAIYNVLSPAPVKHDGTLLCRCEACQKSELWIK